jgi:hypothetical protein
MKPSATNAASTAASTAPRRPAVRLALVNAAVALLVGNAAFFLSAVIAGRTGEADFAGNAVFINVFLIVPGMAAMAIAGALFGRDARFAERRPLLQGVGIALLAYALLPVLLLLWMPVIGAAYDRIETGATPEDWLRDAPTTAVTVSALAFLFTFLPNALGAYLAVRLAHSRMARIAPPSPGASP